MIMLRFMVVVVASRYFHRTPLRLARFVWYIIAGAPAVAAANVQFMYSKRRHRVVYRYQGTSPKNCAFVCGEFLSMKCGIFAGIIHVMNYT